MPKISTKIFFASLSWLYQFTDYFKILNFLFSNVPQEEFQPVKYYLPRISTSKNIKLKKMLKLSFQSFLLTFFQFCSQYLWALEYDPIRCPNQFYIILGSYEEVHMKKKVSCEFHVFGQFPGPQNLDVFLENLLQS